MRKIPRHGLVNTGIGIVAVFLIFQIAHVLIPKNAGLAALAYMLGALLISAVMVCLIPTTADVIRNGFSWGVVASGVGIAIMYTATVMGSLRFVVDTIAMAVPIAVGIGIQFVLPYLSEQLRNE